MDLDTVFPSADGFHDGTDPRRARFLEDEFAGIDALPFGSVELGLLAVHPRIVTLARALLGDDDLRLYSAEAWAKYTGAADYDQDLHRDYLNHTLLVPSPLFRQLELFVYLVDVPDDLGPPHFVPRKHTAELPPVPNWFPRSRDRAPESRFEADARPDLYEREVSAAGPAGTVVAFEPGTVHRGTALSAPRGARYTMHLSFRPATIDWAQRHAWADRSFDPNWTSFVARATPEQLALFGFPPPGHPYWTDETLAGVALRYPGFDVGPYRAARM
jgi:hypothetical protein